MKALKILGIVFGVLLLLTGGGLLVGSALVGKGSDAMAQQMQNTGLSGPVDGTVRAVTGDSLTAEYKDSSGQKQTGTGQAVLSTPAKVGDTVSVYYSPDDPSVIVATDLLGGGLGKLAGSLRTAGIVCLVAGALLLAAGIIGLIVGRKKPPGVTAGPYGPSGGQPYPYQPQPQYPAQPQGQYPYPGPPPQGQPPYPGQPQYPAQPQQGNPQYPAQPQQGNPQYPAQPQQGNPQYPASGPSAPQHPQP